MIRNDKICALVYNWIQPQKRIALVGYSVYSFAYVGLGLCIPFLQNEHLSIGAITPVKVCPNHCKVCFSYELG